MNLELSMQWVDSGSLGYGRFGVELAAAFRRMGITVYPGLDSPNVRDQELNAGRDAKRTNVLGYVSVPSHCRGHWKGQYTFVATMFETQRLPESFRNTLDAFDAVIVPSHQNAEMFGRYHPNVHMVPLGVDPEVWHYEKRPAVEQEFRFLIAGSGPRKGTDLAYAAFRKLWPTEGSWGSGPVPTLVMKNPRRDNFSGPRVEIIGGKIPAAQEVDLYATAHCFLAPSRGEGFGLQPLQAIAQGCPTILTGAHGHDSFAHLGIPIPADDSVAAGYFLHGHAGNWWEPDLDELCDRMRWVYDNYDAEVDEARDSADAVAADFTWAQTAERFLDVIGRDRLEVPYSGPGDWVEPEQRRYRVVTARNWSCDVAGQTYRFEKGREYHETADLKRVLWEAGVLDPGCVDPEGDDHGLTPEQVAVYGEYSAAHAYCESCGQRLGTAPTLTDDIEAELEAAAGVL